MNRLKAYVALLLRYARRLAARRRPRSVGVGRSGRGDVSERAEALLRGMATPLTNP